MHNPTLGRFITMDDFEGDETDPITLNKYIYADDNAPNMSDPTGHESITDLNVVTQIENTIQAAPPLGAKPEPIATTQPAATQPAASQPAHPLGTPGFAKFSATNAGIGSIVYSPSDNQGGAEYNVITFVRSSAFVFHWSDWSIDDGSTGLRSDNSPNKPFFLPQNIAPKSIATYSDAPENWAGWHKQFRIYIVAAKGPNKGKVYAGYELDVILHGAAQLVDGPDDWISSQQDIPASRLPKTLPTNPGFEVPPEVKVDYPTPP